MLYRSILDNCDDCVGRSSDDLKGLQVRFGSKGAKLMTSLFFMIIIDINLLA